MDTYRIWEIIWLLATQVFSSLYNWWEIRIKHKFQVMIIQGLFSAGEVLTFCTRGVASTNYNDNQWSTLISEWGICKEVFKSYQPCILVYKLDPSPDKTKQCVLYHISDGSEISRSK